MPTPKSRMAIAIAIAGCILLPLSAMGQSDDGDASPLPDQSEAAPPAISLPELEGLAWHRSIDLSGLDMESQLSADEVADWGVLLENADATSDQLHYTYQAAFDPSQLPDLGGLATVRIVGVEQEVVLEVVVQDIIDQVVGLGGDEPTTEVVTIGEKSVTIVTLPESIGLVDATVYATGDTAYVFLLPESLVADALDQLP